MNNQTKTAEEQLAAVLQVIKEHEEIQHQSYATDNVAARLNEVIRHYKRDATNSLSAAKSFRDEVLIVFQALVLIADMTGNASTHQEKNARLRGITELLQTTVEKLRNYEFTFTTRYFRYDSVFRSDYPTREYVSRIHQLEEEVKRLKKDAGEAVPESNGHQDYEDVPF